jgi:hypothetical protein
MMCRARELPNKNLRWRPRKFWSEFQEQHRVHTQLLDQFYFVPRGGQKSGGAFRPQHPDRMWIKSRNYGVTVGFARTQQGTPDDSLMAKVEPIEDADCEVR